MQRCATPEDLPHPWPTLLCLINREEVAWRALMPDDTSLRAPEGSKGLSHWAFRDASCLGTDVRQGTCADHFICIGYLIVTGNSKAMPREKGEMGRDMSAHEREEDRGSLHVACTTENKEFDTKR